MRDEDKSKEQLVTELVDLRQSVSDIGESEHGYRDLFECSVDGLAVIDAETLKIVLCNQRAASLYGFNSANDAIGVNPLEFIHPDDRDRTIRHIVDDLFKQDLREPNIFRTLTKDGKDKWISAVGIVIDYHGKKAALASFRDITQSKLTEDALRQSEEKLRLTFESIREGITIADLEGRVMMTNEAGLRMSGYKKKEELIGRSGLELILEKDRSSAVEDLLRQLREGISSTLSYYTIVDKNGNKYDAEVSASLMPDIHGTPIGFIAVVRDITRRKHMEKTLRESEEKLRLTFESMNDSLIIIDPQGRVLDVNEAAVRISGFGSKREVVGMNAFDLISPPDRERVIKDFESRPKGQTQQRMEYTVKPAHDNEFLAEITASSLLDASGNLIGYIAVLRDITEQKIAVEELRKSEERYRLVTENVSDVIWIMDMNARYTYISPSVKRMRGYTAEEMMAMPAHDLVTPESAALILKVLSEELTLEFSGKADPHRVRTLEMESKNKDGSMLWLEVKITFMRDPDGKTIGLLGVSRDITERKRTEEKLKESEKKYKELVEQEKDIIFSVDASGHFTSINSAALSWGFKPEQIIGRHFSEFILPEWHEIVPSALDQILSADEITAELVVSDANGKGHPIEFSATVIREGNEYRGVRGIVRDITERKHIEEALRDSGEKLRFMFESIIDAVVVVDREGKILEVNDAGLILTGYSDKSELIGVNAFDFVAEEDRERALNDMMDSFIKGSGFLVQYRFKNKQGDLFFVEARGGMLYDASGNVTGHIIIVRDITKRKHIEEALRDSEEKLRLTFESINEAIILTDLEGHILDINEAGFRMSGYDSKSQIVGLDGVQFFEEAARPSVMEQLANLLKDGRIPIINYKIVSRTGRVYDSEASAVLLRDNTDNPTGLIVVIRDVSERRRMEEALRDSEEKLRLTFESIEDGIVVIDFDGIIVDVNEATLHIGGFNHKNQVIGRNAFELIAPKDRKMVMDDLKDRIAGRPKERMEYTIHPKDGKAIEVELTASTVRDEKGNPTGYIAVLRDITDRKKAENQLRESEQKYKELVEREKDVIFSIDKSGTITSVNSAVTVWGYNPEEIIGKPYSAFAPARIVEKLEAELPLQLLTTGEVVAEAMGLDRDGNWRPIEFSATVILKGDQFAGVRGIVRDITERKRAEEALKLRNRELATLNKVAEAVSHPIGLNKVLKTALDNVLETMDFTHGSIWLLDKESKELELVSSRGAKDFQIAVATISKALETGESIAATYYPEGKPAKANKKSPVNENEGKSIIGVPLKSKGEILGVLGVVGDNQESSYDDMRLLETIGDQIAVAIENAQLVEKLNELSITDELTRLYNRRHFYEVLESEMNRTRRYGRCISLAMIDLDGFKKYNDKFGHASGDVILTDFANALKEGLRRTDTAFRYGGDEFIVILPSTNAERAKEVIERTRKKWLKKLAAQLPVTANPLGFSAGIAQFPENAETVDGLVFLTDTALYYAKRGGKQRVMLISDLGTSSLDVLSSPTLDQIYALAATVDTRDPFTYGHSKRVAAIAESLGRAIGLQGDELSELVAAAFLHDIGKVGVADVILTKPGKPEKEEWEAIKKHCAEGAKIIQHVKELAPLAPYILHHHEWYDGSGYPDKLKGKKIPLSARIISVADAYDTMTAQRPYREAISPQEAMKEMERCSGTQFDPKLIEALRRINNSGLQKN